MRFTSPRFTSPRFTSPRFTSPRFTSPRFTSPRFTSPRFTSPRFTSPRFTSPRFTSPRFTSPRLTNPRFTSPVQSSPVHEIQYAANFGQKTFTGNRTDTNWSSTTFKGKISVFIFVFNFVTHFCYLRTIRLKQENFSRHNNANYTRRHKFITHKTTAARSSQEAVMTSQCS